MSSNLTSYCLSLPPTTISGLFETKAFCGELAVKAWHIYVHQKEEARLPSDSAQLLAVQHRTLHRVGRSSVQPRTLAITSFPFLPFHVSHLQLPVVICRNKVFPCPFLPFSLPGLL